MRRFTSRPAAIEAEQFMGDTTLLTASGVPFQALSKVSDHTDVAVQIWVQKSKAWCLIVPGDWIIREQDGSGFYPCKPDVFEARWKEMGT